MLMDSVNRPRLPCCAVSVSESSQTISSTMFTAMIDWFFAGETYLTTCKLSNTQVLSGNRAKLGKLFRHKVNKKKSRVYHHECIWSETSQLPMGTGLRLMGNGVWFILWCCESWCNPCYFFFKYAILIYKPIIDPGLWYIYTFYLYIYTLHFLL